MDKGITRIDIERLGHQPTSPLLVRYWYGEWQDGDAAHREQMLENGGRIESLLMDYEREGFTCHMASGNQGRALRGKIVRVDFLKLGQEFRIQKYPFGWTAKTRPIEDKAVSEDEWNAAIAWCDSKGWTVLRGERGARAFKGKAEPVFDRATIQRMRRYTSARYDLALYGGLV